MSDVGRKMGVRIRHNKTEMLNSLATLENHAKGRPVRMPRANI